MNDAEVENLLGVGNDPDWRWQLITSFVESNQTPRSGTEDQYIRRGVRFLRRAKTAHINLVNKLVIQRDYPDLAMAYAYFCDTRSEHWILEAGLLAKATPTQIADYIGCTPEAVQTYAALYFDVQHLLGCRGYIINRVLAHSVANGISGRSFDSLYKLVAYCGGWQVFTDFIDSVPLSSQTRKYLTGSYDDAMLKKAFAAIHRMDLSNFNSGRLVEEFNKIRSQEVSAGRSIEQGPAITAMNMLLQRCVTTISPFSNDPVLDEPRVLPVPDAHAGAYQAESLPNG